uniref:Leucine rich repeat containing 70 n=1 Tax=Varanus komodoensis TaxID=61221 RepID=A0A8D2IYS4_VARKO
MCQLHHLGSFRHILNCLLLLLIQKDILCCPSVCQQCTGRQADCRNSGLSAIPKNFPQNILFLYLSGNNLSHIHPKELIELRQVSVLHLDNSGIFYVYPKAFAEFKKLWCLHLNTNQIKHLDPGTFEGLSHLHSLYLQNNEIAFIPKGLFSDLTSVQYLMLQSNHLSILGTFHHLDNLTYLYLEGNNLTRVPSNAFVALDNLEKLSLNKIIHIADNAFRKMGFTLKILNLAFNNLSFLRPKVLKPLVSLTHLQANYNPWNCSCRLLGLINWLAYSSISLKIHCQNSSSLHGKHLSYTKLDLFTKCFSTTTKNKIFKNIKPAGIHLSTTTLLMAWSQTRTTSAAYEYFGMDTDKVTLWTEVPTASASPNLYEDYPSGKLRHTASVLTVQMPTQKMPVNLTMEENRVSPPEAASVSFKIPLICSQQVEKLNQAFDILLSFFILACALLNPCLKKITAFQIFISIK